MADQRDAKCRESSELPGASVQPIEVRRVLELFMGNAGSVCMLLEKFEVQLRADVAAVEHGLQTKDLVGVASTAHALKGAAGALWAMELHKAAAGLERAAREQGDEAAHAMFDEMKREVERCLAYLPAARAACTGGKSGLQEHHGGGA